MFMGSISAEEEKKEIAKCVYKNTEETETREIVAILFTDYKFDVTDNFIEKDNNSTTIVLKTSNLQYTYFLNDDNKFKCPPEIYLNSVLEAGGNRNGSSSKKTYTISNNKQTGYHKSVPHGIIVYDDSIIFTNDEENSEIYIESPSVADEEEGWLKTCSYGTITLRFNKEKYYFSQISSQGLGNMDNLMDLLKQNAYACPTVICSDSYTGGGVTLQYYNVYFDYSKSGKTGCITGSEYSDSKYSCVGVNQYYSKIINYNNKYQDSQSIEDLNNININKDNLEAFCNTAMSSLNYNGVDRCVKECLEVETELSELLEINPDGECGFSGRLLSFFSNILRWIKYILPVIVIVFGILDFMKAMGADKDDEMKKAQGKFVKRLIAAALVFIIPLIIQFILEKMGFGYDACGLF